jgi:hypothetical protein
MAGNIVHLLQAVLKGNVMALSYEDLIEPAIGPKPRLSATVRMPPQT